MNKKLDEIVEEGASLSQQVKRFADSIKNLEEERKKKDYLINELKSDIENTKKKLAIEQEKARSAEKLKETIYAPLIQDLFNAPKEDLKRSVIEQSRKSSRLTSRWAIGSIIIALVLAISTYIQARNSEKKSEEYISQLQVVISNFEESTQNTTSTLLDNSNRTLTLFQKIWPNKFVEAGIIKLLKEEKDNFNSYKTKRDIALFQVMKLMDDFSLCEYEQYQSALKSIGVKKNIPTKKELSKWSDNLVLLYESALDKINKGEDDLKDQHGLNFYDTYKVSNDSLDYAGWGWGEMADEHLVQNLSVALEQVKNYQKINSKSSSKNKISRQKKEDH